MERRRLGRSDHLPAVRFDRRAILGSGYLGWARVLFDGKEVWRGLTTSLGKRHAYYGGYIESTGFAPGEHTIRVESLAFDHHPVEVAAFGFDDQPVQK